MKILKIIGGVVIGFIVLAIIGSFLPDTGEKDTTTKNLKPEEKIIIDLEDALGKYSNRKDENDKKIKKVLSAEIKNNYLFLKISADDNLFGKNYIIMGVHQDIIDIMKNIDIPDVEKISFEFYFSFLDENYNKKELVMISCWLNKDKFDINWKNVQPDHIPNIVIDYYKHPGV